MVSNIKRCAGFTFVELGVVLVIVGVLFVGALTGLGAFKHSSYSAESEGNMERVKELLINFAVVHKYLPCPDTDGDGLENRNGIACAQNNGAVPYSDIGAKEPEVMDGWGNAFRYAVNTDTTDTNLICDKRSSASYFCNQAAGNVAWFTFEDTPPLAGNPGGGNYTVCSEDTATCNNTTADSNIVTDSAIALLVAFNEDGATTLANCGTEVGANLENCETTDAFYHQLSRTTDEVNFFDDQILSLGGYEVKAKVLSSVISWNSFNSTGNQGPNRTPTFETFDLDTDADVAAAGTSGEDVVLIKRNVSRAVDYGDGDDYVAIGNDLEANADVDLGSGDDSLYIVNNALSTVYLGPGNDSFVLETDLLNGLYGGTGNDKVWIKGNIYGGSGPSTTSGSTTSGQTDVSENQYGSRDLARNAVDPEYQVSSETTTNGNVETTVVTYNGERYERRGGRWNRTHWVVEYTYTETIEVTTFPGVPALDMGADDDVLWFGNVDDNTTGISTGAGDIDGGGGYDILVLENMSKTDWINDSGFQSNFVNFELVIFESSGGTREHIVL